jgi:hypothetical protein
MEINEKNRKKSNQIENQMLFTQIANLPMED